MKLTGLRRDQYTAGAPGIFKEEVSDSEIDIDGSDSLDFFAPGRRFPGMRKISALPDHFTNRVLTILTKQIVTD